MRKPKAVRNSSTKRNRSPEGLLAEIELLRAHQVEFGSYATTERCPRSTREAKGTGQAPGRTCLELVISGKTGELEFSITRRFRPIRRPAPRTSTGKLGPVTSLATPRCSRNCPGRGRKSRSDPAPQRNYGRDRRRQATMTGYPVAALKACDAAGYSTVKFTGYVVVGARRYVPGIARPPVTRPVTYRGYNWRLRRSRGRKTGELLKEIEDSKHRY